jgi:hypothetical protein
MNYRAAILAAMQGRLPMQTHEIAESIGLPLDKRDSNLGRTLSELKNEGVIRVAGVVSGPTGFARNLWEIAP